MFNVPTKEEIAQILSDRRSKKKKQQKRALFVHFQVAIIRGMVEGNGGYYEAMGYVPAAVEKRLRLAFPEWNLRFRNFGTGCEIFWS